MQVQIQPGIGGLQGVINRSKDTTQTTSSKHTKAKAKRESYLEF